MSVEALDKKQANPVANPGDAVMNALGEFIAPMVGAPKPGEHAVHVIMSGGDVVDDVSTTEKDKYGVEHHLIPVLTKS